MKTTLDTSVHCSLHSRFRHFDWPITKSRHLTFFGHLARMAENADASQTIFEPSPENWRRPPGRPHTTWMKNIHDDLSSLDLGIHEARDPVQNRPLCRLMFAQCYALVAVHATIGLVMLQNEINHWLIGMITWQCLTDVIAMVQFCYMWASCK